MHRHRANGLTLLEIIVLLFILGVLIGLIAPIFTRHESGGRRTSCASNLKQLGTAMFMYADDPANGMLPTNSHSTDPFAAAPMPSLNLLYNSYVADPRVFSCPANPIAGDLINEIAGTDGKGKIVKIGTPMSFRNCSYGYDPGHSLNDATTAIAADRKGPGANSDNHGANAGQNVLIGGGTVVFYDTPTHLMGSSTVDLDIFILNPETPRDRDGYIRQ